MTMCSVALNRFTACRKCRYLKWAPLVDGSIPFGESRCLTSTPPPIIHDKMIALMVGLQAFKSQSTTSVVQVARVEAPIPLSLITRHMLSAQPAQNSFVHRLSSGNHTGPPQELRHLLRARIGSESLLPDRQEEAYQLGCHYTH